MECVEEAVQQDAVVLEREVLLLAHPGQRGDAPREVRVAVTGDEGADPLELLLGRRRVPAAHLLEVRRRRRSREIDLLEETMHGVADLGRCQSAALGAGHPRRWELPHPGDAPRVVSVRAAVEFGERRERQAADAVQRRRSRELERR